MHLRLCLSCLILSASWASGAPETIAVSSATYNHYTRTRLPDGRFKPEFFILGEGGSRSRPVAGPGGESLTLEKIVPVVAAPLAKANYLPVPEGEDPELLILVFWGTTVGSSDRDRTMAIDRASAAFADFARADSFNKPMPLESGGGPEPLFNSFEPEAPAAAAYESALWLLDLANRERDRLDGLNARILGYSDALQRARFVPHMNIGRDIFEELGSNRYYVVLQAYDFATALKHKRLKPLWTTRISVRERGNFADALNRMVANSTRFFGQKSQGLRREWARETTVELGPLRVIEVMPSADPDGTGVNLEPR